MEAPHDKEPSRDDLPGVNRLSDWSVHRYERLFFKCHTSIALGILEQMSLLWLKIRFCTMLGRNSNSGIKFLLHILFDNVFYPTFFCGCNS